LGFFGASSRRRLIQRYDNQSRIEPTASSISPASAGFSHAVVNDGCIAIVRFKPLQIPCIVAEVQSAGLSNQTVSPPPSSKDITSLRCPFWGMGRAYGGSRSLANACQVEMEGRAS